MGAPYALAHARAYAAHGWPVLTLAPGEKRPARAGHGFKDATTDLDTIRARFEAEPGAGVGIHPGPAGLLVLDVDTKNGAPGLESLASLEAAHGALPATLKQRTPSGGFHLVFKLAGPGTFGNRSLAPGIDVRCAAGYIAVEPTRLAAGAYLFEDWDIVAGELPEIAPAPAWLLDLLRTPEPRKAEPAPAEWRLELGEHADIRTVAELRSALNMLNADDYQTWIENGQRLKGLGLAGRGLWLDWSAQSPRFDPAQAAAKWNGFKADRTGYGAVFKAAQAAGWLNPASRAAALPGAPIKAKAQNITTAGHLMDAEFPPLRWCVPDILPEGTYLLSAKPKVGKSWLALQMGYGIASAGVVLGKKVEGGSVLVLALEDNKRRLKSRLEKLGAFMFPDRAQLDRLHVETEWPRVHEGGAEAIEDWLKANPDARLVVIDTLAKFRPTTGGRASAYEQDYQALAPVKALSDKYRVTVLVVTHNRKMESDDALDLISGTMGLSGGCDGALVIERERASPTAKLHLIGRDIENDGCFAIEFHKHNCTWSMVGDASVITKSRERDQLMQVFKDERRPLTRKEVIELTGRKPGTVGRLIAAMVNEGNLTRTEDGRYTPLGYHPEQGEQRERGEQAEQGEQVPCSPSQACSAFRPVRPRQHKKPAAHGNPT